MQEIRGALRMGCGGRAPAIPFFFSLNGQASGPLATLAEPTGRCALRA